MHQPKVSIIINNYNYAQFLSQAISSALEQTYLEIEVIVVDDGSQDRSQEIIRSYGSKIAPVLKSNGGQASAFNAGFAVSSGIILLFLDADDYLLPQTVANVVAAWKPDTAKLHYPLAIVDAVGNNLGIHPHEKKPLPSDQVRTQLLSQGRYLTPVTSGNAFARHVLKQIMPIPENNYPIAADGYLTTLAPFYGSVIALEEVQGVYRIHGKNLWALGQEVKAERYCKFVEHDLLRYQLLKQTAKSLGYSVPHTLGMKDCLHLKHRLLSLRLTPQQHPIIQDCVSQLTLQGVMASWQDSTLEFKKRLRFSIWFLWSGCIPLKVLLKTLSRSISSSGQQCSEDARQSTKLQNDYVCN